MTPLRPENTTRVVGRSQGYVGLPVVDLASDDAVTGPGTPVMLTAWEPTPRELRDLSAGGMVVLQVVGRAHPPVHIGVQPRAPDGSARATVPAIVDRIAALVPPAGVSVGDDYRCRVFEEIRRILEEG